MKLKVILAGLAFVMIWSSAFTSARIIVAEAPPMLSLALRFLLSGLIGIGLARALGQTWKLTTEQWRATIIFGLCQNAIYLGLNFFAMQTVEAGIASIVASLMPLAVAFGTWIFMGERLNLLGICGLAAGVLGASLIMGVRLQGNVDPFGILLCFVAMISLAIATLSVRTASSGGNLLMIVGLQMLVGAVFLAIPGFAFETWDVTWTPRLTTAFMYTLLFPGLIATVIWFWLVGEIGAVKGATFHFLNPFFGVATAALILGEAIGATDIIGVIIIMLGIWAVQTSRSSAR